MRGRSILLGITLAAAGCAEDSSACTPMRGMNRLLTEAALIKLDIYDAAVARCEGTHLAPGAPQPLVSWTFAPGAPVRLDVPPGERILVLTTFANAEGTLRSGTGCSQLTLAGGGRSCLTLSLEELDASVPVGGCTTDDECGGATPLCDLIRHGCVECRNVDDCPSGKDCAPEGRCLDPCTPLIGCTGARSCCGSFCVDVRSDPLNCGRCGRACVGGDTLCCNGECANPATSTTHCGVCGNSCSTANSTPLCSGGACAWACNPDFIHCQSGNTGCETASNTVENCGGCGNVCTPANATENSCDGKQCRYTCASGFEDCVKTGANTDGCETPAVPGACGMCGQGCDTFYSLGASCMNTSCSYTGCVAGWSDCDQTPPNLHGCESADVTHMNGAGGTFTLPCSALGDYSQPLAEAAAKSWYSQSATSTKTCSTSNCVYVRSSSQCGVWCYSGSYAGRMRLSSGSDCSCPSSGSSTMSWN